MDRRDFLSLSEITALGLALLAGSALKARAQAAPLRPAAWPNRRLLDLLKIEHPIVQAPMAGHVGPDMCRELPAGELTWKLAAEALGICAPHPP